MFFISPKPTVFNVKAILFFGLTGLLIGSTHAFAQQIYLRPSANIDSSIIRLGDIAEIVGGSLAEKSALQKLELFPMSPSTRSLSVSQIRDELAVSGVDLLRWRLLGANHVSLASGNPVSPSPTRLKNNLRSYPATPIAPAARLRPAQQMTTTAVRHAGFQQPLPDESEFVSDATGVPANPYRNNSGNQAKAYGWTVRTHMDRGAMVGEMDLELIELDRQTQDLVVDKAEILGKIVRNRLIAGQPIRQSSLEMLKYVQRGKEVKIVSQIDAISVSTVGRSLADATLGQDVTVESIDRKKKYVGRVTDFQTVTVSPLPNQDTIVASRADQRPGFNDPRLSQGYQRTAQNQPSQNQATPGYAGQPFGNSRGSSISNDRLPANSLR